MYVTAHEANSAKFLGIRIRVAISRFHTPARNFDSRKNHESVGLRKCPYKRYLTKKVMSE